MAFHGLSGLVEEEKELTLEAANVAEVLLKIRHRYAEFNDVAYNPKTDRLHPEFMIVVNGKLVQDQVRISVTVTPS